MSERSWVHPSELPNFDRIPEFDGTLPRRHRTPALVIAGLSVLALAALTLALRSSSPPQTSALGDHPTVSIDQLPQYAQAAAASTIELVIAEEGHVQAVGAIVISPGNLAVTTEPISDDASITGVSQAGRRFPVALVNRDTAIGYTVVRLGAVQTVTPTGVLPASATVLAIAPVFTPGASKLKVASATTVLGDPVLEEADGIVSYLTTASAPNLRGYVDTVAIDGNGDVVAILSAKGQWFSADYVSKVARVVAANGGCHGRLGIEAEDAQGGGVVVVHVAHGPSWGHLRRGDVLHSVNGVHLESFSGLLSYLYASSANQGMLFDLTRSGHNVSIGVVLGCQP